MCIRDRDCRQRRKAGLPPPSVTILPWRINKRGGFAGWNCGFAFQTVSYTHLDVYKRQGYHFAAHTPPISAVATIIPQTSSPRVTTPAPTAFYRGGIKRMPVSYTHLDVYKRQAIRFPLTEVGIRDIVQIPPQSDHPDQMPSACVP